MADWKPGDLAMCVAIWPNDAFPDDPSPLRIGAVYTVTAVKAGRDIYGHTGTALQLDRSNRQIKGWAGFTAGQFIKLEPHEFDEEDLITIDLYKRVPEQRPNQPLSPCPAENILSQHGSLPGGDATTGGR